MRKDGNNSMNQVNKPQYSVKLKELNKIKIHGETGMKRFKPGKLHFLKILVDTRNLTVDEYVDRAQEVSNQFKESLYKFDVSNEEFLTVYLKLEEPIFIYNSEMLNKIEKEFDKDIKEHLSLSFNFDINQSFRKGYQYLQYM